jgi:hypothetical protein
MILPRNVAIKQGKVLSILKQLRLNPVFNNFTSFLMISWDKIDLNLSLLISHQDTVFTLFKPDLKSLTNFYSIESFEE